MLFILSVVPIGLLVPTVVGVTAKVAASFLVARDTVVEMLEGETGGK